MMMAISLGLALAALLLFLQVRRLRGEVNRLLQEKQVMVGFVHDVGEIFAGAEDVDTDLLLNRILFYALRILRGSAGAVYLFEKDSRDLRARAVAGMFPPLGRAAAEATRRGAVAGARRLRELVLSERIAEGEGVVGEAALGRPVLIEDPERDPRVPRYEEDLLRVDCAVAAPMRFHDRVLGVIVLVNRADGVPFTRSDLTLLESIAEQASVSVHFSQLREAVEEKRRIDHDLNLARRIQKSLLPERTPEVPGFELAAFNQPALEVGGDYYDFLPLGEGAWGLVIADVSGKGVSGAIIMALCRSVLRSHARHLQDPLSVLREVDRFVCEDIAEDMFISMLYAVLDVGSHTLKLVRAGHEKPLHYCAAEGEVRVVESRGIAIGIADPGTFDKQLEAVELELEPGDVLLMYTDGIVEAMDRNGNEWGIKRLVEALRQAAPGGAAAVADAVRERLDRFTAGAAKYDDITLLVLSRAV